MDPWSSEVVYNVSWSIQRGQRALTDVVMSSSKSLNMCGSHTSLEQIEMETSMDFVNCFNVSIFYNAD